MFNFLQPEINATRLIQILVSLTGIIVWILYANRFRSKWRNAVGPISYFGNALLLYLATVFTNLSIANLNLWSNVVRLHAGLLFITVALNAIILDQRRRKKDVVQ